MEIRAVYNNIILQMVGTNQHGSIDFTIYLRFEVKERTIKKVKK